MSVRPLASRPRARRGWRLCSCLWLLVGTACSDPQRVPLPEIEWEGEHLRAGGELADVCEGNLAYMDALVGELQQRLGTPGENPVDYYYFASEQQALGDRCEVDDGQFLVACTSVDQEVFSLEIPMEHELVHAVHAEVGVSHPFVEEGLAEYLGDDADRPGRGEPMGTPTDAITAVDAGRLPLGYYALAGHFVSFLDDDLGTDQMIERIDAIDFDASATKVEAALAAGVQGGFTALQQQYQAVPQCAQASYRDAEPMCNVATPLFERCSAQWDASADVYVDVDCSGSDVLGPRDGEIWTYRTFEISTAGTYEILSTAGTDQFADGIVLKRCGGGCQSAPIGIPTWGEDDFLVQEEVDLEPGRYLVRFTRPVDQPATIRIRFVGDACE